MASKGMRTNETDPPPRPLVRAGACENIRFWDHHSSTARALRTDGDFYLSRRSGCSDDDTESTASESDSPNCVAYESSSRPQRRKSSSRCSAVIAVDRDDSVLVGGNNSTSTHHHHHHHHQPGTILAGLKGTFDGLRSSGSRCWPSEHAASSCIMIKEDDPSTRTTFDHHNDQHYDDHRRTTTATRPQQQRSSNIPVQRRTSRAGGRSSTMSLNDPESAAEQALQAHLQQHYTMRTWDMYHRITQGRKRMNTTVAASSSPAQAASIDHCLSPSSRSNYNNNKYYKSSSSAPPDESCDNMLLDHEMLFSLDD